MKKNLVFITAFLIVNLLQAQPIDYNNLDKEYRDVAVQAFASVKVSTKKWVEVTSLKHPPGNFDSSWAKAQVLNQFKDLGNDPGETSLMIFLFAYQKIMNEEARENRKIKYMSREEEIKNKETKLNLDNKKIDQQKQEASEKYDNSMTAANTQSGKAVVSSSNQVANNKLSIKSDSLKQKPDTVRKQQVLKINAAEKKDNENASSDHRRAVQDNIRKLLDIIAEAKRGGKL